MAGFFVFNPFLFAAKYKRELINQPSHQERNLKHATVVPYEELGKLFKRSTHHSNANYFFQNSGTNKMTIENICTRPKSIAKVQIPV